AVHVVELETLHLGAVRERRVRRREPQPRSPDRARARAVELPQRTLEDAAPRQPCAVERAAERIEDQQLRALAHLARYRVVRERRDEFRDSARVGVAHSRRIFASRISFPMRSFSERMYAANCSGVSPTGSAPSARRLLLPSRCSRAFRTSALTLATISRGVPAGARIPYHELAS